MVKIAGRCLASGISLLVSWSLANSAAAQEKVCTKPYQKVLPFQLPLGVEQASISLINEVRFAYDCKQILAQAEAGIAAQFLSIDLDLLGAQVSLVQNQRSAASNAYARLMVFGLEVAREDFDLENLIDESLSPESDFDYSEDSVLNVGPVPVPLKYGVEGRVALELKAGLQDLEFNLQGNPLATSRVYVQAAANIGWADVSARGKMLLIDDQLKNNLRLSFESDDKLYLRLSARSQNFIEAFDGDVLVKARFGSGIGQKSFERELFSWPGVERDDLLAEFSDRLALFE